MQSQEVVTTNVDATAPNGVQDQNLDSQTQTNESGDKKLSPDQVVEFNERLLKESQKFKSRAMAAERELKALQEKALEEEGKAIERAKYYEEKYNSLHKQIMAQTVHNAIEAKARQLGAPSPEAVVKLGNYDFIDFDEQTNVVSGVDQLVDEVKKKYPALFGQVKTPTINPMVPTPGNVGFNNNRDYSSLSKEQILAELKKFKK